LRVLELHRLKYRSFFDECIRGKPAVFFYGAKDPSISIKVAAEAHSAGEEREGRHTISTNREIGPEALHTVWEAAQWPASYEDPVGSTFTSEELTRTNVLYPGLHDYLQHREEWISAAGKLYKRKP
jgi:hypothetical protein